MRIKVDFSEFFDDERKLSVVNVNTQEAATVNDVLHKIIRVFKLAPTPRKRRRGGNTSNEKLEFGLFEEGFYVPPEETSTVLQDVGILKLKPLCNVNEEIVQRKKKKHKIQKAEEEEEEEGGGGGGGEEEHLENDDENTVKKRRRSKRNKDEVEEIIKEGRKSKRNKDEAEEIIKEGRKSKRNKDEAEEIIKEGRKSKRHGVDVEENNRGRKGRKRKESVETDVEEEEEEDAENVDDYKKGKRQTGKKSRFAQTSDAESSNEEQSKKTKRKEKPQTESDNEVEERKSKRKSKRNSVQNTTSLTLIEEVKDTPLKNKKLKNDKIKQEEECLSETETKQTESESAVVPETKSRKCTRQSVIEVNEASAVRDCKNLDKYEEKRSQEKEISTSNVIHVESDEACESSSGSDGNSEKMDSEQDLAKDSVPVSSIADESHMLDVPKVKRQKRRRKHKKSNKQHPQNEDETGFPNQNDTSKTSHNVNVSSDNFETEDHPMKFQHKNSDVSTSSMGSHIHFKSDDEEQVTSANNSGDGNDIEIIGTASRTSNKRYGGTGPQLGNRGHNARTSIQSTRSHRSKPSVIEIGGDDTINRNVEDSALCGYTSESFHSSYVQKSRSFNYDNMATLRKMCENKTITIVNVNTTGNTVTSQPVRIPSPISPMRRGPPLPAFQSPHELSEAEKKTFYNILTLQNRTVPLVVRTSREALVESIEDVDDSDVSSEPENSEISRETETKEVPVQASFSPSTQNAFQEKTDKDSFELLSIPSTSGYIESCTTLVDKPGPSTKISRKAAPRSFEAIGAVLSNLRMPQDSCEESETDELQMDIPSSPEEIKQEKDTEAILSSPEEIKQEKDTEAIPSSPEEIKQEKDTEAIPSSPNEIKQEKDTDVTSTQGEATTMDEIVFAEALNIQDENEEEKTKGIEVLNVQNQNEEEKTKGNSPSEPALFGSETDPLLSAVSYDTEENRQLMKEMITETLKEDLLKELKKEIEDGDEDDDSRFLKFPLMKTLPKVGEYLAVKVLSLDEKLRPVHSRYIQVQVQDVSGLNVKLKTVSNIKSKDVNKVTDEDGVEEVDLTFEEEVDLTTEDKQGELMELDWRDVLEPRHLFP